MNVDTLRHFYNYHFFENRKLWDANITSLSYEKFTQAVNYSYGSVRDQVIHLISVDNICFSELYGVEPSEPLPPTGIDDRTIIRALCDKDEQRMRDYLADIQAEMLFEKLIKEPEEDKDLMAWQVLFHVVNHGTD
jgi:uncharacterized damage-inducible protein DinB